MSVREEFVIKALEPGANISALSREYGISRKTGYKWISRFKERGVAGLEDLSRRPLKSPLVVSADVAVEIIAIRKAHQRWEARKIRVILQRSFAEEEVPSERTVVRVLERAGFIQRRRKRRRQSSMPTKKPRILARKPNDLWTVDYKGWWMAWNSDRCEPLTIRDAVSRFVLAAEVLSGTALAPAREVFEAVFRRYGLPRVILSDNGIPFVAPNSRLGLTRLSAWWISLGIEHVRSRPGTPSDNGGHERMHRDMAEELEAFSAMSRKAQQQECQRWRHEFNHHRPHEALGMKTPADSFHRSHVAFDGKPAEIVYPERFRVFTASKGGLHHSTQATGVFKRSAGRLPGRPRIPKPRCLHGLVCRDETRRAGLL